jgi:hypothetical protein
LNYVQDDKGYLPADAQNILNRQKNHFCQLLNVYRVTDVRQTKIHTANQPASKPGAFQIKRATEKLKTYKSPGTDQILAQLNQSEA